MANSVYIPNDDLHTTISQMFAAKDKQCLVLFS